MKRQLFLFIATAVFLLTFWNVLESTEINAVLRGMDPGMTVARNEGVIFDTITAVKDDFHDNATVPTNDARGAGSLATFTTRPQAEITSTNLCPEGLTLLQDTTTPFYQTYESNIPPVLYQTAKDRCISTALYNATIQKWLAPRDNNRTLSFRFYDDARMDEYLYNFKKWNSIFPALPLALQCIDHVRMPVMKADIWRYLVLWEFGGIFADLDVLGTQQLMEELLESNSDALFVLVNTAGSQVLSQWFLAVSPHHSLVYYAMEEALFRILQAKRAIPIQHSGPRALYDATNRFLNYNQSASRHLQVGITYREETSQGNDDNITRSFRVLPVGYAENNAVTKEKSDAYKMMNMTHYTEQQPNKQKRNKSGTSVQGGNKKPYNGTTCMQFLGGEILYPDGYQGGASATSRGVRVVYQGRTFSFQNPMPRWIA
jgi:hypothetical protein